MVKKNLFLIQEDGKRQYLRMFLLGFCTLMVVLLPIVIFNKGYFIYYGDFNSQQIPDKTAHKPLSCLGIGR